jgi:hypothetical protein
MTRGCAVSTVFGRVWRLCAAVVGVTAVFAVTAWTPGAAAASDRECVHALLSDWSDGSIDGVYPAGCYLAALDALPEDLRAYTSAADDINRALQASTRSRTSRSASAANHPLAMSQTAAAVDEPPTGLLALAVGAGVVVVAGVAGVATRRLRHPRP